MCLAACTVADTPWAWANTPLDRHPLGRHPLGRHLPGRHPLHGPDTPPPGRHPHPQQTATAADGTRAIGMHSCLQLFMFHSVLYSIKADSCWPKPMLLYFFRFESLDISRQSTANISVIFHFVRIRTSDKWLKFNRHASSVFFLVFGSHPRWRNVPEALKVEILG